MPEFGTRSKNNLSEAHPDLQRLFNEVIKYFDCSVIEGYRGEEEQNRYYHAGKSKAKFPQSRHNQTPSLAVDVVPYFKNSPHIRWDDKESFYYFAGFVKGVAYKINIGIIWGGDWDDDKDLKNQVFFDLPHFQIKLD